MRLASSFSSSVTTGTTVMLSLEHDLGPLPPLSYSEVVPMDEKG